MKLDSYDLAFENKFNENAEDPEIKTLKEIFASSLDLGPREESSKELEFNILETKPIINDQMSNLFVSDFDLGNLKGDDRPKRSIFENLFVFSPHQAEN